MDRKILLKELKEAGEFICREAWEALIRLDMIEEWNFISRGGGDK